MIEVKGSSFDLNLSSHQMNLRLLCLFSISDLTVRMDRAGHRC
jgi:hypothetical protein